LFRISIFGFRIFHLLGREHRARQHTPGDVSGFEPVLQKNARRIVGALSEAADDQDLAVAGEFAQACAELAQPDEKFFVGSGRCDRGPEDPDDRGALGAAEAGTASGDHIGRDAALRDNVT